MENKWLCDSCLKRDVCLIQITHNADTPIVDCNFYLDEEQESITKNDCAEQNGCITCSLDDGDDCCRKLYEESMQEPTTKNDLGVDCISRADAIRVASGYCHPSNVAKELAKLPSVTPQEPKIGHWEYGYAFVDGNYCKCSECKEIIKCIYPMHYCPNCGAKMSEPQESEE